MLKTRLFVPALVALALAACDDTGATGPAGGAARLSLLLTDAPGDMKAAVVTITDVYLQGAEGDSTGRVYLRQGAAVTTNLLTLSNDVLQLVENKTIPSGRYAQLRFVISGGYVEVEKAGGGSAIYASSPTYAGLPAGARVDGELMCPSCAQSGFKVLLAGANGKGEADDLEVDGDYTLLVDFDVSQSFGKQAGNSGKWILKPTLKATQMQSASSVTVTLALNDTTVKLPVVAGAPLTLGGFSATLVAAAGSDPKTVPLTDANNDGVFEATFRYLLPGEYRAGFVGPAGITFTTDRTLPFTVTATAGANAPVAFKLTAVN